MAWGTRRWDSPKHRGSVIDAHLLHARVDQPTLVVVPAAGPQARTSLHSRFFDFWMLGGASFAVWLVIFCCYHVPQSSAIQQRLTQMPIAIAFLALIVNHPHFMSSYKFAYGRGPAFIFKHWVALLAVPAVFAAASITAFTAFNFDLTDRFPSFSFQGQTRLGPLLMMFIIQSMYLTVGWHYSKQVFGCMMTYAKYDRYRLSSHARTAIKASVFSVALLQFIFMTRMMEANANGALVDARFPAFGMLTMNLPEWLLTFAWIATAVTSIAVIASLINTYRTTGKKPSINFLTPWLAFYLWWLPVSQVPEFLVLIPFFHSAQYLPFAWKLEHTGKDYSTDRAKSVGFLKIVGLLIAGFLAFEYVPLFLDQALSTDIHQGQWFFMALFPIGINVHHFFMDSVIWRSKNQEIQQALYGT